ncbi:MAG: flagellar hook-basal body complex protein [Rickettsiaceae bacterium H1]|nr:flagellar hook-basal body complex protein [Rickettsiaceae bacterium H1]
MKNQFMEQSKHTNLSGKISLFNQLQVANNNIANANTGAFKQDVAIIGNSRFKDLVFTDNISTVIDNSVGSLKKTDNPLDLAITVPDCYFGLETPQGLRYTRDGGFFLNGENRIVNKNGFPLLGRDGKIISMDFDEPQDIFIDVNGVIFSGGKAVDHIGVFSFDNPNLLRKEGNSFLYAEEEPKIAENFQILQSVLEESNVSSIKEMTNLVNVSRSFDQATNFANNVQKLSNDMIQVLLKAE